MMRQVCFAVVIRDHRYGVYYSEDGMEPISLFWRDTECTAYMKPMFQENRYMVPVINQDSMYVSKVLCFSAKPVEMEAENVLFWENPLAENVVFFQALTTEVERRLPRFWKKGELGQDLYERHWVFYRPPELPVNNSASYPKVFDHLVSKYGDVIAVEDENGTDFSYEETGRKLLAAANKKWKIPSWQNRKKKQPVPESAGNGWDPQKGIIHIRLQSEKLEADFWHPETGGGFEKLFCGTGLLDEILLREALDSFRNEKLPAGKANPESVLSEMKERLKWDEDLKKFLLHECGQLRRDFLKASEENPYDFLDPEPVTRVVSGVPGMRDSLTLYLDSGRMQELLEGNLMYWLPERFGAYNGGMDSWNGMVRAFLEKSSEKYPDVSRSKGAVLLLEAERADRGLLEDMLSVIFDQAILKEGSRQDMASALSRWYQQQEREQFFRQAFADVLEAKVPAERHGVVSWWELVSPVFAACYEEYMKVMGTVTEKIGRRAVKEVENALLKWQKSEIFLKGNAVNAARNEIWAWYDAEVPRICERAVAKWIEDPEPKRFERIFEKLPLLPEGTSVKIPREEVAKVLKEALSDLVCSGSDPYYSVNVRYRVYLWTGSLKSGSLKEMQRENAVAEWGGKRESCLEDCIRELSYTYKGSGLEEQIKSWLARMCDVVQTEAEMEKERIARLVRAQV